MEKFIKSISEIIFSRPLMGLLAIVGVIAVFKPYWFYDPTTEVSFELVSTTPVFNVRENIGKLTVLYDSKDITSSGGAIYSLTVNVVNKGRIPVKKGDYDEQFPVGIEIGGGIILEQPVVRTSNDYLKNALQISRVSLTGLTFSPVILNPQDSFALSLLILGKKDMPITVSARGKIAGQGPLSVHDISEVSTKKGFWAEVKEGDLSVHAVRAISYFLLVIIGMVFFALNMMLLSLPFDLMDNRKDRRLRRQRLEIANEYIKSKKLSRNKVRELVLSAYVDQAIRQESLYDYLLAILDNKFELTKEYVADDTDLGLYDPPGAGYMYRVRRKKEILRFLKSMGSEADDLEDLVAKVKAELKNFLAYLDEFSVPRRVPLERRSIEGPFYKGRYEDEPLFDWNVADA